MLFHLLQADTLGALAEQINQEAEMVAQPTQMSTSLWSMFNMGGPLMWVLLALSILAIYLIGRKWWMIRNASKIDPHFMQDIRDYMNEGKTKSAITLCGKYDNPVARMVETGIHRMGRPMSDIQNAIENCGNVEVARLEKGLPLLASIAGGAPMIGFLGTVLGMVKAFFNMSKAGNNIDITLLSDGIYTAMLTTVGGLIVGIIAYFGYNWLTSQISDLVYKMESSTMEFIDIILNEPGVFLLLIFFLVTSTLINPNALKLLLPKSTGQVNAKATVSVSIKDWGNDTYTYHVNGEKDPVSYEQVEDELIGLLSQEEDPTFSIFSDQSVPVGEVVQIMNIAKRNHYKVILATQPE